MGEINWAHQGNYLILRRTTKFREVLHLPTVPFFSSFSDSPRKESHKEWFKFKYVQERKLKREKRRTGNVFRAEVG